MVSRVASVIAKGAENILRAIFRWRDVVSQLRVTIRLVVFLICCFLLGTAMKPLPIKGQMGAFKPSIALSNLVLGIALVCRSIQALDSFVSKFTLLTENMNNSIA
jgi:ABC-type multidrug transport system fused ATPase/permease subunit